MNQITRGLTQAEISYSLSVLKLILLHSQVDTPQQSRHFVIRKFQETSVRGFAAGAYLF